MQISYSCKILNVKLKKLKNTTGTTLDIIRTVSQDFLTLFCQKFHWDREGGTLYTGIIYANLTETLDTEPVPVLTSVTCECPFSGMRRDSDSTSLPPISFEPLQKNIFILIFIN